MGFCIYLVFAVDSNCFNKNMYLGKEKSEEKSFYR